MCVAGYRKLQQGSEIPLARCGSQQIIATHHLVDTLVCVVDHHRKVVGGFSVPTAQHQVVDDSGEVTV